MTLATPTAIAGLHASDPEPLPFAPALQMRSFLLERTTGNLLVYRFADATKIAQAHHVGLVRYG